MAIHAGSWGIGNYRLPDLGLTEKLTGNRTAQGGSNLLGSNKASSGASPSSIKPRNYSSQPYTPVKTGKVLGTQNTYTQQSGGGLPATQQVQQVPQQSEPSYDFTGGIEEPNQELELIQREFDDFNNYLNQQQTMAQSNFDSTKTLMDTQKANAAQQFTQDRDLDTAGIKKNESLNLARVRQLLSDLQQRNAAQTAITGGTGSTSEALAERFGREAQQRLGNVADSASQALERVNTFYNQQITKLNDNYNAQLLSAKSQLDENLNNISYQRNQSATAKQQNMLSAWRNYYDQINNAKLQAAQFKAQYDMWKQQNDSAYSAWGAQRSDVAADYGSNIEPSLAPTKNNPLLSVSQSTTALNPYRKWNPRPGKEDEEAEAAGLNYSPMVGSTVAY